MIVTKTQIGARRWAPYRPGSSGRQIALRSRADKAKDQVRDTASTIKDVAKEASEQAQPAIDQINQAVNEAASKATENDPSAIASTPHAKATDMADKLNTNMPSAPQTLNFLGFTRTQELINGRAAMVGFLAAIASERVTHQATLFQITGRVADGQIVENPQGASWYLWGAVVVILTLASLAPRLFDNEQPEDREYSIWRAGAEILNGRIAMVGFLALLATEAMKGTALF